MGPLCRARMHAAGERGDWGAFVGAYAHLLALSRMAGHMGSTTACSLGARFAVEAGEELEAWLGMFALTAETIDGLTAVSRGEMENGELAITIKGQLVLSYRSLPMLLKEGGEASPSAERLASLHGGMRRASEAAMGADRGPTGLMRSSAAMMERASGLADEDWPVGVLLMAYADAFSSAARRSRAEARARVVLMVERFATEHGRYPSSLDEAGAGAMVNPVTGEVFWYGLREGEIEEGEVGLVRAYEVLDAEPVRGPWEDAEE